VRRATLSLTLMACLVAAAGSASAGGLDVRIGGFFPRGSDTLFDDLNSLYTPNGDPSRGVKARDFRGVFGGIEYNAAILPHLELGVHLDGYGKNLETSYRDYTREGDVEIRQRLKLSIVPLGVTLRLMPTGKNAPVAPYVGLGVDAVFYSYEEHGDLIDFYDPDMTIYDDDTLQAKGAALGVHVVAGLRVYLSRDFAIVGEGRYLWAKTDMGDDFAPNESGFVNRIDLSGASFTIGLHVRF
jgi:hypothetical protein